MLVDKIIKSPKGINRDIAAILIIALVHIIVLWTGISRGMPIRDENLYISIPYRFMQGDSMFVDEWHISQISAFLLYPIVKVYLNIVKSFDGIIISFRYIYLSVQLAAAVAGYCLIKNRGRAAAMLASIIYVLYVPYLIRALSYNTIGLMTVWLIACLSLYDTKAMVRPIVIGLLYGVLVLCCPYTVLIYIIWLILKWIARKK